MGRITIEAALHNHLAARFSTNSTIVHLFCGLINQQRGMSTVGDSAVDLSHIAIDAALYLCDILDGSCAYTIVDLLILVDGV